MNCHEFTTLLDEHGLPADDASELAGRAQFEAHAQSCADCGDALAAVRMLAADPIPAMSGSLDTAAFAIPPAPRISAMSAGRRWRPVAVLAVLGLGGAVFASWSWLGQERDAEPLVEAGAGGAQAPLPAASPAASDTTDGASLIEYVEAAEAASQSEFSAALMNAGALPDGDYFPLLKVAPVYPPSAAAEGLEGFAVVEFTVSAQGDVADISIVESSDERFEAPSIEAAAQFKYKPRITNGQAVALNGVRNKITYLLEMPQGSAPAPEPQPEAPEEPGRYQEFHALLKPALTCLEASELRCIELELEQIAATRALDTREQAEIDRISGFVHFRRGNYQQAIEAYGRAALVNGNLNAFSLMIVARIHYELNQYQEALDAAVQYLRAEPNPHIGDYVFVDKLRQLGATVR
jgi:TonB family protein